MKDFKLSIIDIELIFGLILKLICVREIYGHQ
jgi:hypothetical protein